jgi:hypothetical protein
MAAVPEPGMSSISLFTTDTGNAAYVGMSFDSSSLIRVDEKIQPGVFLSPDDARSLARELEKIADGLEVCQMHDASGFSCCLSRGHGGQCVGLG